MLYLFYVIARQKPYNMDTTMNVSLKSPARPPTAAKFSTSRRIGRPCLVAHLGVAVSRLKRALTEST